MNPPQSKLRGEALANVRSGAERTLWMVTEA